MVAVSLPPTPVEVVTGILALLGASLLTCTAAFLARRTGGWSHLVTAVGGLLIVVGVIGQRTAASGARLGPWDAGIVVPVVGTHLDVVAAAGIVTVLAGITITLLLEGRPWDVEAHRPLLHRALEDDDTV